MGDASIKGRGLLGVGKAKRPGARQRDTRSDSDDAWHKSLSPNEALGIYVSGGMKGKPHSTKEGRLSAGKNFLNRAWGQKRFNKKKGTPV